MWMITGKMLSKEEAKRKQDELAKHYDLGFWYGTGCKKCCDVYPKIMITNATHDQCYFQCEVCSKRTEAVDMPWVSEKLWNEGKTFYECGSVQLSLFE